MVGPATTGAPASRSGRRGLKKLEHGQGARNGSKLLLADESLGRASTRPRWIRLPTCCADPRRPRNHHHLVEHIMGVLMRVVDRVMVLDHGEKISEGLLEFRSLPILGDRGLSRHPHAHATQAAAARSVARGCHARLRSRSTQAMAASRRWFGVSLEVRAAKPSRDRPNARGKTTLMRLISGLIRRQGSIAMKAPTSWRAAAHRIVSLGLPMCRRPRLFPA